MSAEITEEAESLFWVRRTGPQEGAVARTRGDKYGREAWWEGSATSAGRRRTRSSVEPRARRRRRRGGLWVGRCLILHQHSSKVTSYRLAMSITSVNNINKCMTTMILCPYKRRSVGFGYDTNAVERLGETFLCCRLLPSSCSLSDGDQGPKPARRRFLTHTDSDQQVALKCFGDGKGHPSGGRGLWWRRWILDVWLAADGLRASLSSRFVVSMCNRTKLDL